MPKAKRPPIIVDSIGTVCRRTRLPTIVGYGRLSAMPRIAMPQATSGAALPQLPSNASHAAAGPRTTGVPSIGTSAAIARSIGSRSRRK
jgi:hypothetical protein